MLDHALRSPKTRLLRPAARRLEPVPAAALTLAALAAGVAAAAAAALGALPWALGLWLTNRLLDGLDGEVARLRGRQSDLGGYLDLLADLIVYALVPIGLAWGHPSPATWAALAAMLASFYLNLGSWLMLAALLEKRGRGAARRGEPTSVAMPAGLVEGAETVLLFTLFLLLPHALPALFWATAALVGITAGQRAWWAARRLGRTA